MLWRKGNIKHQKKMLGKKEFKGPEENVMEERKNKRPEENVMEE